MCALTSRGRKLLAHRRFYCCSRGFALLLERRDEQFNKELAFFSRQKPHCTVVFLNKRCQYLLRYNHIVTITMIIALSV